LKKTIILKRLGDKVREVRQEKGISQAQLAYNIGKDQQSIHRLESGNVNPSFYYLFEISMGLNVDMERLIKFSDIPNKRISL